MNYDLCPAASFDHDQLAVLFNACFSNYFVPLHVDAATIGNMVRRDGVDTSRSPVAIHDGRPVGFAFLAQRGQRLRIAAMGVMPEQRRGGVARRLMSRSLEAARAATCAEVVLEVISANEPAVRLYESMGFCRENTLWGFSYGDVPGTDRPETKSHAASADLTECSAAAVAAWIGAHGAANLPWQLDAVTMREPLPVCQPFEWSGRAACLITNPNEKRIALLSLVVHREIRRAGFGRAVLAELMRRFPGRTWRVPELTPEGPATAFFGRLGWKTSAIQQIQMCKTL